MLWFCSAASARLLGTFLCLHTQPCEEGPAWGDPASASIVPGCSSAGAARVWEGAALVWCEAGHPLWSQAMPGTALGSAGSPRGLSAHPLQGTVRSGRGKPVSAPSSASGCRDLDLSPLPGQDLFRSCWRELAADCCRRLLQEAAAGGSGQSTALWGQRCAEALGWGGESPSLALHQQDLLFAGCAVGAPPGQPAGVPASSAAECPRLALAGKAAAGMVPAGTRQGLLCAVPRSSWLAAGLVLAVLLSPARQAGPRQVTFCCPAVGVGAT